MPGPNQIQSKQEWDEQYAAGEWNFLEQLGELGRYSLITGYIQHFCPKGEVLDVGCGTGLLAQRLVDSRIKKYTGIDLSSSAIEIAKSKIQNSKMSFHNENAAEYITDKKYDVVILNEVLYYIPDPDKQTLRYLEMLKPKGVLIVSNYREPGSCDECLEKLKALQIWKDNVSLKNSQGLTWKLLVTQKI